MSPPKGRSSPPNARSAQPAAKPRSPLPPQLNRDMLDAQKQRPTASSTPPNKRPQFRSDSQLPDLGAFQIEMPSLSGGKRIGEEVQITKTTTTAGPTPAEQAITATPAATVEAAKAVTLNPAPAPAPVVADRQAYVNAPPGFRHVELPSRCVPYTFDKLYVRPFKLGDIANLISAINADNYGMFLDAIAPCFSENVRLLTPGDLRRVMYWLRMNSFTRTPYQVPWSSKYGVVHKMTVKSGDLKMIDLAMTREEYREYQAKGLRFPAVGDLEYENELAVDDANRWLFNRAMHVNVDAPAADGSWMKARIDKLKDADLELGEEIRDFTERAKHGVNETVTVKLPQDKFDPQKAIEALRERATMHLRMASMAASEGDAALSLTNTDLADEMAKEVDEIEKAVAEGRTYEPKEEVLVVDMNYRDFFSEI